jgi:hypothetical protein
VHGDGGTRTQSGLHGTTGGERLRHDPRQGLHSEHSRCTVNLLDIVESCSSKRGRQVTEGWSSPAQSMAPELNSREDVT